MDDGTETKPSIGYTIDKHPHFRAVRRFLQVIFPDGLAGKTIVDLACLEGGYTVEFVRLGMIATGVEVRESNFRNCFYVKDRVNLPNLTFVRDDVMNIGRYPAFDVIFATGILYHLDLPRRFLAHAAGVCGKAMFLQTHYATRGPSPGNENFRLSELTENEGLPGRWFHEHEGPTNEELEKLNWASWANQRSFWICKENLLAEIRNAGFDVVVEQYDALDDIANDLTTGYCVRENRALFVGIKS